MDYESPYEAKLKEYEQRLAEIDKELLGKTEEVEELVDAETEELSSAKTVPVEREFTDKTKIASTRRPSKTDPQPRLPSMMPQAKPSKCPRSRLRASREGKQPIEDAKQGIDSLSILPRNRGYSCNFQIADLRTEPAWVNSTMSH